MTRLQIMAYNPWNTNEDDVTWGVGYTEEKLYDIIQKVRKDYLDIILHYILKMVGLKLTNPYTEKCNTFNI